MTTMQAWQSILCGALVAVGCAGGASADAKQELRTILRRQSEFNGSIYASRGADVIVDAALGWEDAAHKIPTTRETLFNIASVTKSLTAAAVLKQLEQGKLARTTTIGTLFPNVPKDKAAITIEQLLTHTSGLAHGYAANGKPTRAEALRAILAQPLGGKPGKFLYTDDGYALLAAAVEVSSGLEFCAFLRRTIFVSAHMHARCWEEITRNGEDDTAAILDGSLGRNLRGMNWGYIGSGGIWASADDLARYFQALQSGAILSRRSVQELWAPRVKVSIGFAGFGWFVTSGANGNEAIVTRGNEDWGHSAILSWYPGKRVLIAVVTNSGFTDNVPKSRILADKIAQVLLGVMPSSPQIDRP
jgi:CubicO group peptidase (beta-lactamase class C family)